ncbi:MAG: methyltransferase domain-containing protein [Smithellaceae bacterium]|jgi:SAM-dependent methyltransferase
MNERANRIYYPEDKDRSMPDGLSNSTLVNGSLVDHLIAVDRFEAGDFRWKNLRHLVIMYISKYANGSKILDLGCGTGHLALELIQKGYDTCAADLSEDLVDYANLRAQNAGYQLNAVQMDIQNLPYREAFDAVVCLDVLEHIGDDLLALNNIYQALKSGGIMICAVPALSVLYGRRDQRIGHFRRYDKEVLVQEIESAGFSLCTIRYWNILGLLPMALFEKILHREVYENNRYSQSYPSKSLNMLLDRWFDLVENRFHPPLGITLIAVARKP